MKEFLSRTGRPYTFRNIDEDDEAYRDLVALGIRSVPLTVIGDRRIRGYDPQALTEALQALAPE